MTIPETPPQVIFKTPGGMEYHTWFILPNKLKVVEVTPETDLLGCNFPAKGRWYFYYYLTLAETK